MKLIFKIAKTELRNLFYSPIAWFLMIVFLIQCGIAYTGIIDSAAKNLETYGGRIDRFTYVAFSSPYGMFSGVMQNLYLYIPLLTMGLISREINGGTIKLLYSSPIRIREIVFGKYLAMLIFSLILVLVLGVFLVSGVFNIKSADFGMLLSAALGFYLLLCAYSAIGLFMSSLSSYQVVAAVSTFIMIGILSYIGKLWQGIDFIRDLTYFLSLSGRTSHMLVGLITTKDVIYFVVIVCIFLGFTIIKLKNARESKPLAVKISRYAIIMAAGLIIGYISSRPSLIAYWDSTADNDNTLTPNARRIINDLGDSPLEVTLYGNMFDDLGYLGAPEHRNAYLEFWEPYLRFKPGIKFHYVNYYDIPYGNGNISIYNKGQSLQQMAKQMAKIEGLNLSTYKTPAEIHQMINLNPELNRCVMQLTYRGKSTFLRIYDDTFTWPSEAEVSAAFKRLLQTKMPKIAMVTGDGERNIFKKGEREYKYLATAKTFRHALINQGFDVDSLSLETQAIPDSISALVIADPQTALNDVAVHKIQQYIAKGGNLVIAGEPGRQQLLNPLLKPLGVQMLTGMLEQKSADYSATLVLPHLTKAAIGLSRLLDKSSVDTLPVSTNGVSALSYKDTAGFRAVPLLTTVLGKVHNTLARNPDLDIAGTDVKDGVLSGAAGEAGSTVMKGNSKQLSDNPAPHDKVVKTYTTAVALSRLINGREQRIVISGDADFMSNAELDRDRVANFYLSNALFNWLSSGQFPIDTSRPDSKDNGMTVSSGRVVYLKVLYVWIFPALLLICGGILLIRRKRK